MRDPLAAVEQALLTEEMLSPLRHELRNKFAAIRNASFYLKRRLAKTELWTAEPRLAEMSQVLDHDLTLASQLVDGCDHAARLWQRSADVHDAAACVRRAASCLRGAPAVHVELHAEPAQVAIDPDELTLAIRNLLENAAEASDGGGTVRVSARREHGHYVIQVDDDGPGIAQSDRELVFEPFQSTKPGHAGLGLSIVRRIALRYGGQVEIAGRPPGASLALTLRALNAS